MNKHDNIRHLFKTLTDTLPYEYDEGLTDNKTTIVITKEDSDSTMYISPDETNPDDFTATISHDEPTNGHHEEYETLHWNSEDNQIPLDTILTDIKNLF